MDFAQLKAFLAVTRSGGFAAAAQERDVAPSSITRAVAALENSLGVRLFQRTTRKVTLTEAGKQLLARVAPAVEEIDAAIDAAATGVKATAGLLRVSASVSYGQLAIAPRLPQFFERYPGISLELILSDTAVDLISERIDVAVRHGPLEDSALIARRLRAVEYWLVASPNYLEQTSEIKKPEDLSRHRLMTFTYPAFSAQWRFRRGKRAVEIPTNAFLKLSNALALAECVRQGIGLALLADWTVADDVKRGILKRVLPGWKASGAVPHDEAAISLVTPSRAYVPEKAKAFIRFMKDTAGTKGA